MILSRKLSDALNEQINMEMWSSNLYLSMSVHFTQIGLDGFAHWTLKQSHEELEHAYKMIDYSIKRGESRWRFSSISTSMRCMYPDQSTRLSISLPKRKTRRHKISYGASSESR